MGAVSSSPVISPCKSELFIKNIKMFSKLRKVLKTSRSNAYNNDCSLAKKSLLSSLKQSSTSICSSRSLNPLRLRVKAETVKSFKEGMMKRFRSIACVASLLFSVHTCSLPCCEMIRQSKCRAYSEKMHVFSSSATTVLHLVLTLFGMLISLERMTSTSLQ